MAEKNQLDDKVSSAFAKNFAPSFKEQMDTEVVRRKIKEVFWDEVKHTDFSELVKKYAAEEMDKRVFRSAKYWGGVVATAATSALIGAAITKWLG